MTFDARPLTDPIDQDALRAFHAQLKAQRHGTTPASSVIGIVLACVFGVIAVPLMAVFFFNLASSSSTPLLAMAPVALFVFASAVILVLNLIHRRRGRATAYRLNGFAQANGMTFVDKVTNPPLPGMIFGIGSARTASDLVRGTKPRFVEFGNYQYTVRSGKNSTTYSWGYVAVKLDVPLPNIVLDAKGNNGFGTNLPTRFHREQTLSLEGDFDEHFTLYCPTGYERDALYLFTPDIMARFIDHAAQLDVEIVDDWMFLYSKRKLSTLDPATWAWLFGIIGALMSKFDQWARWRDERLLIENADAVTSASDAAPASSLPFAAPAGVFTPPPGVALPGRRLKRRFAWLPIVFFVFFAVIMFLTRMN